MSGQSGRLSGRVEPHGSNRQVADPIEGRTTNDCAALVARAPRRRLTLARLAAVTEALAARDLGIVATLARVRMATGRQLCRLHFASLPSADRQARRALARLVDLDVLDRLDRTVGGRRAGSSGFIYSLGTAGQRLAGGYGPAHGARTQRPWTPSAPYTGHLLRVTELYVRLREREATGALELVDFEAEPACWRTFLGRAGERVTLKPDAFVRLGLGDVEHLHFVEVDQATESPRTLDRKLDRYRRYVATGREERRWGVFPLVTWLVPSERRAHIVMDACRRLPTDFWPLFQVATFDQAVEALQARTS